MEPNGAILRVVEPKISKKSQNRSGRVPYKGEQDTTYFLSSSPALKLSRVLVTSDALRVVAVETTPHQQRHLLFCQSPRVEHDGAFVHNIEVSDVLVVHEPVETAFPLNTCMVHNFVEHQAQGNPTGQEAH